MKMFNDRGFTLIELLAVIVVLAILLVIAVPRVLDVIDEARKGALDSQAKLLLRGAIFKHETNPNYDFNIVNKENIKDELGIDGSQFEAVGVELDENFIYVTVTKDGITSTASNDPNYSNAKVYGLAWDGNNTFTRTDDAVALTTVNVGVGATPATNNFDSAEIYSEMVEETDSYGNQYIKIPKFFIKKTVTGDAWTWQISKVAKDGSYYLPACFVDEETDRILPYILVGKYTANLSTDGTKLESKTGKTPLIDRSIAQFRTYAMSNGDGYQLLDIHVVDILQTLFYIEFATLDSQTKMYGYANANSSALSSGETDSVVAKSGSMVSNSDGKHAMKYRGIENLWGNVWQFLDGVNIKADRQPYVSRNANTYESDKFNEDYEYIGYSIGTTNGDVSKMGFSESNPFGQFPISVGTSKYGDYFWQATGNRIALYGGYWTNGNAVGISFWNLDNASFVISSAIGSRLVKIPL